MSKRARKSTQIRVARLVQLAHPDRHDNSPAAVEATRWLLENRP